MRALLSEKSDGCRGLSSSQSVLCRREASKFNGPALPSAECSYRELTAAPLACVT